MTQIAWAAVRAYAATVQGGFTRSLEMVEAIEAERGDLGAAQREALTELTKGYIESLPKGAAFRAYRDDLRDQLGAVLGEKPDEKTLKFMYAEIRGLPGVTETRSGSNRFFCGIGLSGARPANTPEESAQNAKKRSPCGPQSPQVPAPTPTPASEGKKPGRRRKEFDFTTQAGVNAAIRSGQYRVEH